MAYAPGEAIGIDDDDDDDEIASIENAVHGVSFFRFRWTLHRTG